MKYILLPFFFILCCIIQPVVLKADSIESGVGCPSGKCPGSLYEKLGYKVDGAGRLQCFCNPNGPCHLRDLESKGLPTGVKRCVWYKGKHLCDPADPNRCRPLSCCGLHVSIGVPIVFHHDRGWHKHHHRCLNEAAKASSIYKHAHGQHSILFDRCWLYSTPHEADIGHKPHGAGTVL